MTDPDQSQSWDPASVPPASDEFLQELRGGKRVLTRRETVYALMQRIENDRVLYNDLLERHRRLQVRVDSTVTHCERVLGFVPVTRSTWLAREVIRLLTNKTPRGRGKRHG